MGNNKVLASKALERYLDVTPAVTAKDIMLITMNINSTDDPIYKLFQQRKEDFLKVISKEKFDGLDKNIKLRSISQKAYNKGKKTFDEKYFMDEAQKFLTKEEAEKQLQDIKINIAIDNKDDPTYEKLTLEKYKDYANIDPMELGFGAWGFAEKDVVISKPALEKAIIWVQESNKKMENPMTMLTLAKLYMKTEDKANAKIWANKSIELAKTMNQDISEAEKLLEELQ